MSGIMDFIGPIAQGALDIGGSLWSTQKQIDFAREQRDYNTPENQMARLKAAGLNPALVYGHGTVANTSGVSINPEVPRTDVFRVLQAQVDMQQSQAQTKLINEQAKNMAAEAELKRRELQSYSQTDKSGYMVTSRDYPFLRPILKFIMGDIGQTISKDLERQAEIEHRRKHSVGGAW